MSNWPVNAGARSETLGLASGTGVTVTSTAAANTKGSYATIGTTGFRYNSFLLNVLGQSTSTYYRLDLAINTGGADTIIIKDFFINAGTSLGAFVAVLVPVRIPAGAVVKARVMSQSASAQSITVSITGYAQGYHGDPPSSLLDNATDTAGLVQPSNSVVQTGTSYTAYTVIQAATGYRYRGLYIATSSAGDTSRTASDMVIDIAIGASGQEKLLTQLFCSQSASKVHPMGYYFIPCDLPAGVRLSFRVICSAAAVDSISLSAHGLVA